MIICWEPVSFPYFAELMPAPQHSKNGSLSSCVPAGRVRVSALAQYTARYSGVRLTLHNPEMIFSSGSIYHPKISSLPCRHWACVMLMGGLKTNVLISAGEGGCFFLLQGCSLSDCSCPVWPTLPPAIRGTPATHSGTQEFHHCLIFRFLLKKPSFTAEKKQEATQKQHISELSEPPRCKLSLLNSVKPSSTHFYLFPFIFTLAVLWDFSLSLSTQLKVLMLLALSGSSLYKSSFSYTPYNSSPLSGVTQNSLHPGKAGLFFCQSLFFCCGDEVIFYILTHFGNNPEIFLYPVTMCKKVWTTWNYFESPHNL